MKFTSHYSSSKGNFCCITADNGKRLLVECGVTWPKIEKALDFDLTGIEGCLLSHDHMDHSRAAEEVMRAGIDLYASAGTHEAIGLTKHRRAKIVEDGAIVKFGSFEILPFDVTHDAAEPLGYVVREKATGEYLLFATDFFCLEQMFPYAFSIIAIGCSYDKDALQALVDKGDINETLAKRLLFNHSSKQWVKKYLQDCCERAKCREIHLLHMSGSNINKQRTRKEFKDEFFITTY